MLKTLRDPPDENKNPGSIWHLQPGPTNPQTCHETALSSQESRGVSS